MGKLPFAWYMARDGENGACSTEIVLSCPEESLRGFSCLSACTRGVKQSLLVNSGITFNLLKTNRMSQIERDTRLFPSSSKGNCKRAIPANWERKTNVLIPHGWSKMSNILKGIKNVQAHTCQYRYQTVSKKVDDANKNDANK